MGVIEKKAQAFDEMAKFVLTTVDPYWITREAIVRYEKIIEDPTIHESYKAKVRVAVEALKNIKGGM